MINHSITSINAVLLLTVDGLFVAQQLQGFAPDDIFDVDEIDVSEDYMGVDGLLSAGRIYNKIPTTFAFAANSAACAIFETWNKAEEIIQDKYFAQALIRLPSIKMTYICNNGNLSKFSYMPNGKKTLQPRKFTINWESLFGAPF